MIIRLEQEKDFPVIYDFTKEAFKTAKVKDGEEQEFVKRMRKSENYLPELAFVAEENMQIVGHIMLTKTRITNETRTMDGLILAPLTVRLDQRGKGVGAKLMTKAEQEAEKHGYSVIILIGDPAYYNRYGFEQASHLGITTDLEIPATYILAKRIGKNDIKDISGTVSIPV
ncbi:GNAT family N-acetyltransferase [Candidatus Enterococcus lemimoniae]|uniref:N-acetyltransferase domain-containing protein n=1 Tax=Candidatus Enterococcus lemimoniae TaxID=1834167 RepID=A0ABZ2T2S8_9ENTE|nr:N-acetyltransferase [Enterococcus sp. 12C11_DIV0727]OTO69058.1 hypothetical protein A5866_001257 [Enterococcus sp. 12C11_DIV0727]